MKILVIGTGLVGGAAVSALSERGHDVVEASRSSSPAVDATDPESIAALFSAVGIVDAVVAAVGSAPYEPLAELDHDDRRACRPRLWPRSTSSSSAPPTSAMAAHSP